MSEAMQAAPKPLSILTTETLGEQVFNMPSSAATPGETTKSLLHLLQIITRRRSKIKA
jgi:hypothetical protein